MSSLVAGVDNDFPDQVTATLQRNNASKQVCCALNTAATVLAVGCSDGGVALYDFETRGVSKLLKGHTAAVVAVSWNATSHHLLSASLDGLLIRWNVLQGKQGSYATIGTNSGAFAPNPPTPISVAAPSSHLPLPRDTAADDVMFGGKRRIKSVQLHPSIEDLAIVNFTDSDAPVLMQLQPLPADNGGSNVNANGSPLSTPNPAAGSPTPSPEPAATTASSSHYVAEPAPRPPLWVRHISTPFPPPRPSPASILALRFPAVAGAYLTSSSRYGCPIIVDHVSSPDSESVCAADFKTSYAPESAWVHDRVRCRRREVKETD